MTKDFDQERRERHAARERGLGDRSFVISGQTFTYKANASYTVLEELSASDEMDGAAMIRAIESAMLDMVDDAQHDEFLAVLRNKQDPYTFEDLNDLASWLVEEQVKRPTAAPSSSTDGDANPTTSTSSKDDSSSQLVEASAG